MSTASPPKLERFINAPSLEMYTTDVPDGRDQMGVARFVSPSRVVSEPSRDKALSRSSTRLPAAFQTGGVRFPHSSPTPARHLKPRPDGEAALSSLFSKNV